MFGWWTKKRRSWSGVEWLLNGILCIILSLVGRHVFHQEILYAIFSWLGIGITGVGVVKVFFLER
jgi:hypothetical protein